MARTMLSKAPLTNEERARVEANRGLVIHYVDTYYGRTHKHRSDLIQEGYIALAAAVRGYDPDFGASFGTYATKAIHRRLERFRAQFGIARKPLRSDYRKLNDEQWKAKLEAAPVVKLGGAATWILDRPIDAAEALDAAEEWGAVRAAVARLPIREREVVDRHYSRGESLAAIGAALGVSRERARQIKDSAIGRLRRFLSGFALAKGGG